MAGLKAVALGLFLAAEGPEYPLGKLRFPSLTAPGRPFVLTDFLYRVSQTDRTAQSLELRLRIGSRAFLGAEVNDQRRGLSLDTQQLELGISEEGGRYQLETSYRAPRFLARARGERRPPGEGKGWLLEAQGALRLGPDLEILLRALEDTDPDPPALLPTRPLRRGALGFLYQRGTGLDLSAEASLARFRTEGDLDLDRDRLGAEATFYRSGIELEAGFVYERTRGRLPGREAGGSVATRVQMGPHLLAHADFKNRWEPGLKDIERNFRTGLTFFGRRHHFARSGEAAARTYALTRRAYGWGYNERRAHDLDGRRALRERLALSARREELAADIDALYRAQVAERNVAQAGFEIARDSNAILGKTGYTYRVFLAVPWSPRWPFSLNEEAVDFLRLDYVQFEERFAPGFRSVSREILLEVALNREMGLRFRWQKPGRTPLEIAQRISRPRRLELEYAYFFGR